MFEYLLGENKYCVKWYTTDEKIYNELKAKGIPVVNGRSLSGIWAQVRAKMLVSSVQLSDFNKYFLHGCIYFDLDHGFVLKQVGFAIPETSKYFIRYQMTIRKGIDYWMSAPTVWAMEKIKECYNVSSDHIVRCNKPRTDALFDYLLCKGVNEIVNTIKNGRKAVIWMPTHRSCGKVPISARELLDLDRLQDLCEKRGFVFIIKKHFYHKSETESLERYPNIFDLTSENLDSQVILSQADALISDYSSSYIEYLALDRPIVLYAYDKDQFMATERGLYIKLENNTAGEVVSDKEGLIQSLLRISNDWYDSKYSDGRRKAKDLYFDSTIPVGEYRDQVKNIISQLLNRSYTPMWDK